KARDRRYRGSRTGTDDNRAAGLEALFTDGHPARAGEPAEAAHEPAALLDEPLDGDLVVPVVGGLLADPLGDRAPVRLHGRETGQARNAAPLGQRVRRADHHLARDTAPVRALAAAQAVLH